PHPGGHQGPGGGPRRPREDAVQMRGPGPWLLGRRRRPAGRRRADRVSAVGGMRMLRLLAAAVSLALLAAAPSQGAGPDSAGLAHPDPGQWVSPSRTYDEQRFSPLTQINDKTVGRLGLA